MACTVLDVERATFCHGFDELIVHVIHDGLKQRAFFIGSSCETASRYPYTRPLFTTTPSTPIFFISPSTLASSMMTPMLPVNVPGLAMIRSVAAAM